MDKCCSSEKEKTNLVEANTFCQLHTKIKGFRLQNENLQQNAYIDWKYP